MSIEVINDLILTFILIIAGCLLFLQLYDFFENETVRMLLVVAYGLFTVFMLFHWFASYIVYQLS
jgi:predicted PurR-regulated permease PerM